MNNHEVFHILHERLKEGVYFLAALENQPILKDKLKDEVNSLYRAFNDRDLINSRHTLDTWTARLEGAGLVDVQEVGRARMYSISDLGREMIEHVQAQNSQKDE